MKLTAILSCAGDDDMQEARGIAEIGTATSMRPITVEELCCVLCRGALRQCGPAYRCSTCGRTYPVTPLGQVDFRLRESESVQWSLNYSPMRYEVPLTANARREGPCRERRNTFQGAVPWHLTRDQISYIPQARPDEIALDLGCGTGLHRNVLEALGYSYYGVDYQGTRARDLVDAHALPFGDAVFDLVVGIALLEHLAQPLLAFREIQRVLKPGKRVVGTAAFLEPFHDNSFCHLSPVGITSALAASDLVLEELLVIRGWNVLRAQLEMGLERAPLPRIVPQLLALPFMALLETYALVGRWAARDTSRHTRDVLHARHAGAFFYVARKAGR